MIQLRSPALKVSCSIRRLRPLLPYLASVDAFLEDIVEGIESGIHWDLNLGGHALVEGLGQRAEIFEGSLEGGRAVGVLP